VGVLFAREKRTINPTFPEPVVPPFPGASVYGQNPLLTQPNAALQVPTVWACVSLLANAVSMLQLETFRVSNGIPTRVTDPLLVKSPAAGMTQSEWLHMVMVSALMRGNAYGIKSGLDGNLRPTQIEILNPDLVRVKVDDATGALRYYVGVANTEIDASKVWHLRGLTLPGQKVGLSPISYAAATLGIDLNSRQFASDFFAGGGIPKAVVTSDERIDREQGLKIKDRIMGAMFKREPLILGAGLKYDMMQVKPEESQFLATQAANVGQIARYFSVPASLVGGNEGGSMTYTNVEQRNLDFLTFGVSFWLKRIEDALFPLLPQPQFVRFNPANLLRTDAETQAKVDVQLIAGKILTPTEVRMQRNMPPMTDAQKKEADLVPLTITPTGGPKALPAEKTPPGTPAPTPADDEDQGATDG
jgi:HK97 family phage portal protein